MSRPDLYDLACANGGMALIPDELCAPGGVSERGVSRPYVWAVLAHRLLHTDAVGVTFQGTPAIADALGIPRAIVQRADAVIERAGLSERVGKRQRAIAYRMVPGLLDDLMRDNVAAADADQVTPEVTPHLTPHLTPHGVTKGSEEDLNPPARREPKPKPPQKPGATNENPGTRSNKPKPETPTRLHPDYAAVTRRADSIAADFHRAAITPQQYIRLAYDFSPDNPLEAMTRIRQIGNQVDLAAPEVVNPVGLLRYRLALAYPKLDRPNTGPTVIDGIFGDAFAVPS